MTETALAAEVAAPERRRGAAAALVAAVLCLAVRFPLLFAPGCVIDQVQFAKWAQMAESGGVASLYAKRPGGEKYWCNYPPVYPYALKGVAVVYRLGAGRPLTDEAIVDLAAGRVTEATAALAPLLNTPAVIADALTAALLVAWLARRLSAGGALALGAVYALTPAVVHDSAVWGQVDSIPTLLALVALESTVRRRFLAAGVFAALAVLTKAQAAVILPIVVIAALRDAAGSGRALSKGLLGAAAATALTCGPLWTARDGVLAAYTQAAGYYPFVHLNGFSAWFAANPLTEPRLDQMHRFYLRDDVALVAGLTPHGIGLAAMGLVTLAVIARLWQRRADTVSIRWAAGVLPLAFFVLGTQMHERYLLPAVALWAWACDGTRRWAAGWAILILATSVNMLWAWPGPAEGWWPTAQAMHLRGGAVGSAVGIGCAISVAVVLIWTLLIHQGPTVDETGGPRYAPGKPGG